MLRINAPLALALSALLIVACSKDEKKDKEETKGPATAAGAAVPAKTAETQPTAPAKAGEAPSNVLGLFGGGAAQPAQSGDGLLGGDLSSVASMGKEAKAATAIAESNAAKRAEPPAAEPMAKPSKARRPMPPPPPPPVTGPGSKQCKTSANKVVGLVMAQMQQTMKPEQLDRMKSGMSRMVSQLVSMCMRQKWSAALHACVAKASNVNQLKGCKPYAPKKNPRSTPPKVPDDKVVASGNAECDTTAKHVVGLLMSKAPPAKRQRMSKSKVKMQNMLAAKCAKDKWPASVHKCVRSAKEIKALDKCDPKKHKQ
jgi:hypothetical protein